MLLCKGVFVLLTRKSIKNYTKPLFILFEIYFLRCQLKAKVKFIEREVNDYKLYTAISINGYMEDKSQTIPFNIIF